MNRRPEKPILRAGSPRPDGAGDLDHTGGDGPRGVVPASPATASPHRPWLAIVRALVRGYLRYFPLRNGKGWLYRQCQEKLLPPERHVVMRVRQGFRLRLDLMDPAQRQVYFFGEYDERHEIRLLTRLLLPGDRFWDVGANIGYYTLTAAKLVAPAGRVVAFEPGAAAWQSLKDNVALNPGGTIRLERLALSDRSGEAVLHRRGDIADGGASLSRRADYHQAAEVVTTTTLMAFLAASGEGPPDFLKIDVEGHEDDVLAGGAELLEGHSPPLLLIEMNDPARIGARLSRAGYHGVYLRRGRWRLLEDPLAPASRNVLWFRPDNPGHRERLVLTNLCA